MTVQQITLPAAQTLEEAIAQASLWTVTARPIVKALFAVDDAAFPITHERLADPTGYAGWSRMSPNARAWEEAQKIIRTAKEGLEDMLDGIRDNFLCDERQSGGFDLTEAEEDAIEEFNADLERSVVSVAAFVKQMGASL